MLQMLQMLQLQLGESCNNNGLRYLQTIGCEGAAEAVYRSWLIVDGEMRFVGDFSAYSYDSTKWGGKGDILENHLVS
jgi:hypothetical protein